MPTRTRIVHLYEIGQDNSITESEVYEYAAASFEELSSIVTYGLVFWLMGIAGMAMSKYAGGLK